MLTSGGLLHLDEAGVCSRSIHIQKGQHGEPPSPALPSFPRLPGRGEVQRLWFLIQFHIGRGVSSPFFPDTLSSPSGHCCFRHTFPLILGPSGSGQKGPSAGDQMLYKNTLEGGSGPQGQAVLPDHLSQMVSSQSGGPGSTPLFPASSPRSSCA